jgi:predicted TIM-barrel fold metal-dependent hydrolase
VRDGYRIIDIDTHVTPSLEVLAEHAEPSFRPRFEELRPYQRTMRSPAGRGHPPGEWTTIKVRPIPYERIAGQKPGVELIEAGGAGPLEAHVQNLARKDATEGVQHDNPTGRLRDMDVEGVDVDLVIPGTWATASSGLGDVTLTEGLYRAYHRYMRNYCGADPNRLKGLILAPGGDLDWAIAEVRAMAREPWVGAVWLVLPEGLPIDDPDLNPLWDVMNDANLPLIHHSFFYEPPYFPGYRDIWGNSAIARTAAHVWGSQRFLAYLICGGVLDRYPNIRAAVVECGHGWLPNWLIRLTKQIDYVKGSVPRLKHTPVEYAQMGRVFNAIEMHEGEAMTKAVVDILGDGVLMYESDYPHPESQFPDSPAEVIGWMSLGQTAIRKLLYDNAARYLRLG